MAQQSRNVFGLKQGALDLRKAYDNDWLKRKEGVTQILVEAGRDLSFTQEVNLGNVKLFLQKLKVNFPDKHIVWLSKYVDCVITQAKASVAHFKDLIDIMDNASSPKLAKIGQALVLGRADVAAWVRGIDGEVGRYFPQVLNADNDPNKLNDLYSNVQDVEVAIYSISTRAAYAILPGVYRR